MPNPDAENKTSTATDAKKTDDKSPVSETDKNAGADTGKAAGSGTPPTENKKTNDAGPAKPAAKKAAKKATKPKKSNTKSSDDNAGKSKASKEAAAKFVGIDVSEVLDFSHKKNSGRYVVVTIAGQKLTETADERAAREKAEAAALKAKQEAND